ncbi:tape measure protein [Aeromonas sp. 2692-1]|uniref:tape measure protein n=1 Tax=Aeromonas sp. 2692-1 TaxID=2560029 RepID=UPI00148B3429|nr:tape measure protein [Aeromonas sp. 2692-1]QJT15267.1 tape measure protein [Aeromonas sp. 2692-1]
MANKLVTDIVINLAGNMAAKARQYGQSMSQFAAQSKSALAMMNSTMAATSQGIDTFGNRLVLAGAASAIAFERTFIKTAAEFERYQIMLNKLQGGPEGGAKAMSWVKQFAQDTPYAVNEVTQSFVRLKAFGLDPMDGTMQAIADQAAMMGGTAETMDGISLALGQAWTKGKLQGEEALQLLERGVPVWDYLQKASKELGKNNGLGYTNQQLQDMASKGQLTRKAIKDLIDQMGLASKGAAKTQMESWNGMISNMGDSWTMFKTDVMDSGAFTVLKQELGSLLKQLDEMKKTGEYDELVEKIGGNLVDSFKAAAEAIRDAKELGAELIPVLKSVGETANGIADMVGGYENLAKILGSIYLLNKGGRLLAPVAKGAMAAGGWAAGAIFKKGKGGAGGIGDAMADLGATPVYVVNMPGSGFGDGSLTPAGNQAGNKSVLNVQKLIAGGTALYGVSLIPELGGLPSWSRQEERAKELANKGNGLFNLNADGISPAPGILDVFDEMKAFFTRDISASPRPDNLSGTLDINVRDDRITVRTRDTAPGLQVRVDNGPSLMP